MDSTGLFEYGALDLLASVPQYDDRIGNDRMAEAAFTTNNFDTAAAHKWMGFG